MGDSPDVPAILNQNPFGVTGMQNQMNQDFVQYLNNLYNSNAVMNQAGSQYQQTTPYGQLQYKQTGIGPGGVPLYTSSQQFSPQQQALLDTYWGNQAHLGQLPGRYSDLAEANMNAAGTNLATFMNMIPNALGTSNQAAVNLQPSYGLVGQATGMIPGAANRLNTAADTLGGAALASGEGPDLWPMIQQTLSGVPDQLGFYKGKDADKTIGSATTGNTEKLVGQMTEYYEPFFNQQTDRLDNQLRNQGFAPGTPGFDNAMGNNLKAQNAEVGKAIAQFEPIAYQQAYQNFMTPLALGTGMANIGGTEGGIAQNLAAALGTRVGAMTGVGQAQAGLGKSEADIASQLSAMGMNSAQISGILNQIAQGQGSMAAQGGQMISTQNGLSDILNRAVVSMMGLTQPTYPQFNSPAPALNIQNANGSPANLLGAVGQSQNAQLQAFNTENQQNSNFLSGLFGIGSKALPLLFG
jgi:hypothetical protein